MIAGNQTDTIAKNQHLIVQKKLKKLFGHIDPTNPPEICPIRDILSPSSDKWSILIFIHLGLFSVLRFNELKKYIRGISAKILSDRLKYLEQDGYIKREMYAEVPVRVEYELTDFGCEYLEKLIVLIDWIDLSMPEILKKRHQFNSIFNNGK
jgi:DNA-binding HxlR family transcriptional regulator